jgi:hypothetical protein
MDRIIHMTMNILMTITTNRIIPIAMITTTGSASDIITITMK